MGILRTDKISGLETSTAVTGSVSFDGTDDALIIADHGDTFDFLNSDFTVECWIYPRGGASSSFGGIWTKGQPYQLWWKEDTERIEVYASSDGSNYNILNGVNSADGSVPANQWSHIAHTREGDTFRIFVNGILTSSETSSATIFANTNAARISDYDPDTGTYELDGEISNLRVLKGTALYTADFTPPTHALEVIKDTIILCCNNPDSVTASAFAGIGTAYAITTAGNPTVATRDPGLTRDFTYGTEFRGVTTFDTQGYFVPPSGTTTERYPTGTGGAGAGTRGVVFGGYYPSSPNRSNVIDYITIATLGNAQDFGDRLNTTDTCAACASATRALNAGGYDGSATINTIEYVTIASTGNAVDFGDTRIARRNRDGCASSTRGLFGGGYPIDDAIDYVTIATQGTSSYFGNLTSSRYNVGGLSSPTRGVFAGGQPANGDTIDYVTIATTGDAVDFGNLTASSTNTKGASSTTRGIFGHNTNVINYITIASLGDAQDFGDLNYNPNANTCTSSLIRGVFMGGGSPTIINTISYITIASTGDAVDFGDLTQARQSLSATSSGHGGLG